MFKFSFELFKRIDPYLSLGGYVGAALSALGITGAAVLAIATSHLSWFWETFHWAGALVVGFLGWVLFGIGFSFFRSTRASEERTRVDYWLLGAVLSAVVLIVCLAGHALDRQKAFNSSAAQHRFSKNVAGPPIEWRFDKPVTIFLTAPYKDDELTKLDGLIFNATNKSDFALKGVKATIVPDLIEQKTPLRVNTHGAFLAADSSATLIPPRSDFELTFAFDGPLLASRFLKKFGSLKLIFEYEENGAATSYVEIFPIGYLEDQLEYIEKRRKEATAIPRSRNFSKVISRSGGPLTLDFPALANSEGKSSLFKRSQTFLSSGDGPNRLDLSFHQFFVAIENHSKDKTLRHVRVVMTTATVGLGAFVNLPCICERTRTEYVDIPPGGTDYFLVGSGWDNSDAGMFHPRFVTPEHFAQVMQQASAAESFGIILESTENRTYPLLKNDGIELELVAHADDTPSDRVVLTINTKRRIEMYLEPASEA